MFQVTQFALIVDSAPPGELDNFISAQGTVLNLGVFIGPLLMSALANAGMPIVLGLFICAAGRALSTLYILAQPKTKVERGRMKCERLTLNV